MAADFTIKRNDLLRNVIIIASDAVGPVDLDGVTATFRMVNVLTGAVKVNDAPATAAASIPFTASGATISAPAHNLNNNENVTVKTTGALPGNLSTSQKYFVVGATQNALGLALIPGGPAIVTSGAGSGTHSLLSGRVTYEWTAGDTNTPGTYSAEFTTLRGGLPFSFPNADPFLIEVISTADATDRTIAIHAVRERVEPNTEPKITQGEIERAVDSAKLASVYTPGATYNVRDCVLPPTRNGYSYRCIQPGVAGSLSFSEFSTDLFDTFTDGQGDPLLTWENAGTDRFNPGVAGAESNIYDIGRASRACWLTRARRCADFVDEGDTSYSQMYDHAVDMASSFDSFTRPTRIVRIDG
jgi:hypothetical protein